MRDPWSDKVVCPTTSGGLYERESVISFLLLFLLRREVLCDGSDTGSDELV